MTSQPPVDPVAAIWKRVLETARTSTNWRGRAAFSQYVLRDTSAQRMDIADIHRYMLQHVDQCWADRKFCGVLAPWRHGKTTLLIEGVALQEIGRNPNTRIKAVSGADDEAMRRSTAIRRYITDPAYQAVYPHVHPANSREAEWTKHSFFVERTALSRDPTFSSSGVLSSEAGGGYDIVMFDDVCTHKNTILSGALREQVYGAMTSVWLQRIDPRTRVVLVGTRWHSDDAYGRLMNDPRWRWLVIGVNADITGFDAEVIERGVVVRSDTLPLWSERSRDWLKQIHDADPWSFERGYRQHAPAAEDRLFGELDNFLTYGVHVKDLVVAEHFPRYGGFDPGTKQRPGNALVTCAVTDRGKRVITSIRKWQGSQSVTTSNLVLEFQLQRWSLLMVENNGTQDSYIDAVVQQNAGVPVEGFLTTANKKADPIAGIPGLNAELQNGTWVLCMDDPYDTGTPLREHLTHSCGCAYCGFIRDLTTYKRDDHTPDSIMAWWFCREAVRRSYVRAAQTRTMDDDLIDGLPDTEVAGTFMSF